jgi:hypothetical protein
LEVQLLDQANQSFHLAIIGASEMIKQPWQIIDQAAMANYIADQRYYGVSEFPDRLKSFRKFS